MSKLNTTQGLDRTVTGDAEPGDDRRPPRSSRVDATDRLLASYSAALDSIGAGPAVVFMSQRAVPRLWAGRALRVPRANFLAGVLAEMHTAARVDSLLRRGHRLRALGSDAETALDLDRLGEFRSSLKPVSRRAAYLWVALLSLAVAFPVAWMTDNLRVLVPRVLVCGRGFNISRGFDEFTGNTPPPPPAICNRLGSGSSLVEVLVRVAHLNLNPGGVIDTVLSVRASGVAVALLLVVVLILCVSTVLVVFRSGFRLKRLAFSSEIGQAEAGRSLLRSSTSSGGVYALESEVFRGVGLGAPREFPLDLIVSAGLLVVPLTMASDLFVTAAQPQLGTAIPSTLVAVGVGLISLVAFRLSWLVRARRSRTGTSAVEPRERWLPDGSTVLVRTGAYGAILLATAHVAWFITEVAATYPAAVGVVIASWLVGSAFAWPLCIVWWYRLQRELAATERTLLLHRPHAPAVTIIPPLCIMASLVMEVAAGYPDSGWLPGTIGTLWIVGIVGVIGGVYRMGRRINRLTRGAAGRHDWRSRAAGLRAFGLFLVSPAWTILRFQHSLNRVWRELATPGPVTDHADLANPTTEVESMRADPTSKWASESKWEAIACPIAVAAGAAAPAV
jgi:hypothetical protein